MYLVTAVVLFFAVFISPLLLAKTVDPRFIWAGPPMGLIGAIGIVLTFIYFSNEKI